jgi:serine acetyltransferase/glycosyltransferase involved in cell wall biosynthesis
MNLRASVVIATHNRPESACRLLRQLAEQGLPTSQYEVILVDDGSIDDIRIRVRMLDLPPTFRAIRTDQGGPAAARDRGVQLAHGEILIFLDDDMQVEAGFIEAHLARHQPGDTGTVVLGNIQPDPGLAGMPLFERFHARQLERSRRASATAGPPPCRGVQLCTGNVSMRRADYLAVGGFDRTLERSEDRELGIRLEASGCSFVNAPEARSTHSSDHRDAEVWLRRASLYGRYDLRIARMHPGITAAHPRRFWRLVHPLSRPLLAAGMMMPRAAGWLAHQVYRLATRLDRPPRDRVAVTLTAVCYALQYFRGLRDEAGSLRATVRELRAPRRPAGRLRTAFREMRDGIRADHDSTRRHRLKYHGEEISTARLPLDLVRKVGLQMLACYRVMRFFDEARIPLLPQLISRLIRHLYGAEIHWKARIAGGVSIVHGVGLVISHGAEVRPGCILFQNVTLGENLDPLTGTIGSPRLGLDVHVGPGATLLGPITVGAGSKIAAGAVLMESVPPMSLVQQARAFISSRQPASRSQTLLRPRRRSDIEEGSGASQVS